jgi:hypothetical protein
MEIVLLLAGLALMAVGIGIIVVEVRSRRRTMPVRARVIGFSVGKSANPNMSPLHTVAEYVGLDGRKYYVEASTGSSAPLHAVDDEVAVLVTPGQPDRAVLKSSLSFFLGGGIALLGLVFVVVFRATFRLNLYSAVMAALVVGGLALKIRRSWRKRPLTLEEWQAYKNGFLSTKVFTDETKDKISWADPGRVVAAIEAHRKANRFAVPTLLVLGIGLLLLSYHFYGKTEDFLQTAQRAPGRVMGLRAADSSDGETTYSAVVTYTDDHGRQFTFEDSLSSTPPMYAVGQEVNVLYQPENPNEAGIDRGIWNYSFTALLGVPGAALLMCGVYQARKRFGTRYGGF